MHRIVDLTGASLFLLRVVSQPGKLIATGHCRVVFMRDHRGRRHRGGRCAKNRRLGAGTIGSSRSDELRRAGLLPAP